VEFYLAELMEIAGYGRAIFALWLLIRCALSMLREKNEPEVWAYLERSDGSSVPIHNWECLLGRSRSADVRMESKTVERTHAALQRSARGHWLIYNLTSAGETCLNERRVEGRARLLDGDVIRLGEETLNFIDLNAEQRKTLQRKRQEPGRRIRPGITLLLLTGFQLFLALEHAITAPEEYVTAVTGAFIATIIVEWMFFFFMRSLSAKGFEVETLAFFLSSVGLSVTASSAPSGMAKACALLLIGLGLFASLGWWLRDLRRVKLLRWPMAFLALAFLGFNLALSQEVFGARNWLTVAGVTLQPTELVKVAYVYAGAATLDRLFQKRNLLLYMAFSAAIVGAAALMGDFGTALVFFVCFLVVSFMRSGSFATVLLSVTAAALACGIVLTAKPYVARRFATWGHVWEDPLGAGYQQVRALCALASGGLFGQGAGNGWLRNVPAADTDLVFAMTAEELGGIVAFCCLGAVVVLSLFAVRNVGAGRSAYYVIASCAAVSIMMVQTGLNVFGSLDILPFTGVTFPFVSKGGSSLVSCWALLAYIKANDTRRNASFALSKKTDGDGDHQDFGEADEYTDDAPEELIEEPAPEQTPAPAAEPAPEPPAEVQGETKGEEP